MINNPKLINKIKQQLKNTTKEQLDKAIKMNEKLDRSDKEMREIKFRCYDNKNNQMLDVQNLDFEDCFCGGETQIKTTMYGNYFDIREMPLMQYTGLHDKNGKEIYEGDMVKTTVIKPNRNTEDEYIEMIMPVVFEEAEFLLKDSSTAFGPTFHHLRLCKSMEVIGNIYNNSELLEVQNEQ